MTLPANYGGQSDIFNIGTTLARTEKLTLSSSYEFVRGSNLFSLPGFYADVGTYSTVVAKIGPTGRLAIITVYLA